MFSQWYK